MKKELIAFMVYLFAFLLLVLIGGLGYHAPKETKPPKDTIVYSLVVDYTTYNACIEHIKKYEGFRGEPYELDGAWYIGYGKQITLPASSVTEEEATEDLKETFNGYVERVSEKYGVYGDKALALALLWYNVSPSAIVNSEAHRLILSGSDDFMSIRDSWMSLSNFQGKPHIKLRERRQFEVGLFFNCN